MTTCPVLQVTLLILLVICAMPTVSLKPSVLGTKAFDGYSGVRSTSARRAACRTYDPNNPCAPQRRPHRNRVGVSCENELDVVYS